MNNFRVENKNFDFSLVNQQRKHIWSAVFWVTPHERT